mmetsp:Transcript_63978/g.140256  ORF Transcript_63978/g.140256 Transcript_63978/m.140256 type:complete len:574 (-) Transcript_63978:18-1739(-)
MKLLALVLLDAVLAAKFALRAQRAHVASQDAASCKGNVLPADLAAGPHKTLGKAQFSDVIDADKLRAALEASQFWIVGKSWELSMTANSMRQDPVTYAFTGGGHGFLTLTVPGGVVDEVLYATDTVKSLANESGFEYRGKDAVVTDHDVILTNLCLRPKTCGSFKECLPISDFKPVEDPETPGNTREDCCIPLMCKDTQPCNSTKYVKSKDWETLPGSTEERCCTPQPCTEEVCKGGWKPKLGSGLLGSTPAECCEPRLCTEYLCSETTTRGRRIGLQYDEECCEDKSCKSFNCTSSPYWSDKEKKGELRGSTFLECCETLYCEDFTCSPTTQWSNLSALLPNGEKRRGFASELCCEKLTCEAFNCSSPKLKKKPGEERLGSTDEECCEPRLCEQYTCSSATKWVHKADVDTKKHSQAGWSDEECCDKVMCSAYSCSPATMWKPLNASYRETAAGSTNEECCEPRFCADYTCSGDADGDGESSKYYKKVDTNHFKNKGSTDEECCVARSCSQYTTEFPSKFKRKEDKDLLGSTDAECYDPVWCKDYCCKDRSKVRKSDADRIQGSSDEECCTA